MQSSHFIRYNNLGGGKWHKTSILQMQCANMVFNQHSSKNMPAICHNILCSSETARELHLLQMQACVL